MSRKKPAHTIDDRDRPPGARALSTALALLSVTAVAAGTFAALPTRSGIELVAGDRPTAADDDKAMAEAGPAGAQAKQSNRSREVGKPDPLVVILDGEAEVGRPGASRERTSLKPERSSNAERSAASRPERSDRVKKPPTTSSSVTADALTKAPILPPTVSVTTSSTSGPTASTTAATTTTLSTTGSAPKESPTSSTAFPTSSPTTAAPTTVAPTTVAPTTVAPTTVAPTTVAPTTTAREGGVVWVENFDRLDPDRWRLEHSSYGDGNGERQCYRPENVAVTGGKLVLTARHQTYSCPRSGTRTVTSGMVRSRGLTFSPGQAIEFRVKLTPADPSDQGGLWPAVWASSWAGSWPVGGEMDWLEVMTAENPRRSMHSIHFADRSGSHELLNKGAYLDGNFSDSWHTVRFDYGHNGRLRWYLDGRTVFEVNAAETLQGYPAPFDRTVSEIKINLATGGTPGPLSWAALGNKGATFEVDYIKVFNL